MMDYPVVEVRGMDDYGYRNLLLSIGLKISYYRKMSGLSQEELAERVGVSTTFIGMVEAPNIIKAPSLRTLYMISEVLNVPVHKFLQTD